MQSGFWFESHSTASATAPFTCQENEIDMQAKILTQVLCGQQGAFLLLIVPPSGLFSSPTKSHELH